MTGDSAGASAGFLHATTVYDSDDAFLSVVAPFLHAGLDAAEPTLLGVGPDREELIRDALGDTSGITLLASGERYARPITALGLNHDLFTGLVASGASHIRIVGEVPHPGTGAPWDGWVRYEAAINHLYATLPVSAVCPYDARITSPEVLADVVRLHSHVAIPGGGLEPNPQYVEPAEFLAARARTEIDPLEATPPHVALADPSPAQGRHAIANLAAGTALDEETVEDLVFAVSETIDNAHVHGRPPVEVQAWAVADRVVVAVHDRGGGPADPWAGYLPGRRRGAHAGLGLWIANQVCDRLTTTASPDGFVVRLVCRTPVAG